MSYIDVRFHFDKTEENGYTHYNLKSVQRDGTDIPDEAMLAIGETLAQSDRWNTGGVGAVLSAMVENTNEPHLIESYW